MPQKTIITLTDQPKKWSSLYDNSKLGFNFIISNSIELRDIISHKIRTDLLIISQSKETKQAINIHSIISFLDVKYTLYISPEHALSFVHNDLPKIADVIFKNPTHTGLTKPGPIQEVNTSNSIIHLNGFLLGPFHLLLNGLSVSNFASKKYRSLLAYLLYHNRRPSFRETLMEVFWPDVDPDSARNSLNVAIHSIRQMLKRSLPPQTNILILKQDKYFFNPSVRVKLDYEDFRFSVKRGQQIELREGIQYAISDYEEATRLYNGDLLEDSLYDDWSYTERENLKEHYLYVLDRLSEHYCKARKFKVSQHYCRKLLEKDECREDIHRRMMHCLFQTGHRGLAVKQYKKCETAMLTHLDIMPGAETKTLLEEIKNS